MYVHPTLFNTKYLYVSTDKLGNNKFQIQHYLSAYWRMYVHTYINLILRKLYNNFNPIIQHNKTFTYYYLALVVVVIRKKWWGNRIKKNYSQKVNNILYLDCTSLVNFMKLESHRQVNNHYIRTFDFFCM